MGPPSAAGNGCTNTLHRSLVCQRQPPEQEGLGHIAKVETFDVATLAQLRGEDETSEGAVEGEVADEAVLVTLRWPALATGTQLSS